MTINEQNAQATNTDIAIGSPTEVIIFACKSNALRCRVPGTASELTLRTAFGMKFRTTSWRSAHEVHPGARAVLMNLLAQDLRCLHGKGLALWRIGRMQNAAAIFQRLLWLNPSDNQGARFCLAAVEAGQAWKP